MSERETIQNQEQTADECVTCKRIYREILALRIIERQLDEHYARYPHPDQKRAWEQAKKNLAAARKLHAMHVQDRHQLRIEWK